MKKINISTTTGIVRSINYTTDQNPKIDKDLAVLYLTVLFKTHKAFEDLAPIPIWFYGLNDWRDYLSFFNRLNLIYRIGNSFSCSDFLYSENEIYEITDFEKIEFMVNEVIELQDHISLA